MAIHDQFTIFYDGACPLCKREIEFYKRRRGAAALNWLDVSRFGESDVAPGLSKSAALARFHIRDEAGNLLSGGAAFAQLWRRLPAFRLLGIVLGSRPQVWLTEAAYNLFLLLRPRLQRLIASRCAPCNPN